MLQKLIDQGFSVRTQTVAGEECALVCPPHMGAVTWTPENLIYRSSIWTVKDWKPVSLSFKKFFNLTEAPNVVPDPTDINGTSIVSKIDGSTLLISKFKDSLVIRTRGSFDTESLENWDDIETFKDQYPQVFDNQRLNEGNCTFVYEWTSPQNRIVLDYGTKPLLFLTNIIHHSTYLYESQDNVAKMAKLLGVLLPPRRKFQSLGELIDFTKEMKGAEGFCIYYNNDQDIKKIKSLEYLKLHAFKANITLEALLDLFLEWGRPDYKSFAQKIVDSYDWECANMAMPMVSKICDAQKVADSVVAGMKRFIDGLNKSDARKINAQKIIQAYGTTGRSGFVFNIFDGKELDNDAWKKLLFQALKD